MFLKGQKLIEEYDFQIEIALLHKCDLCDRRIIDTLFIESHKTPDSCLVMERQPEGLTRIYRV